MIELPAQVGADLDAVDLEPVRLVPVLHEEPAGRQRPARLAELLHRLLHLARAAFAVAVAPVAHVGPLVWWCKPDRVSESSTTISRIGGCFFEDE